MNNPQQEHTQAAQQATQEAAQVMTAELFALLTALRQQHDAQHLNSETNGNGKIATNGQLNGKTPAVQPIEIRLDGETVYQEDAEGVPLTNRLGLQAVEFLQVALEHEPGERIAQTEEPSLAVQIGEAEVLSVEKGVVTRNELHGKEPTKQQSGLQTLFSAPQNGNGMSAVPPVALPVSIQEPLTFQVQRLREQPPSILERLDNAAGIAPLAQHPQWMKVPLRRKFSEAMLKRLPALRQQRVADTAIDLLQKYGARQGQSFIYETEGYTIRGEGKLITVSDREDRKIVALCSRVLRPPKVMKYYLTPTQEEDFLKIHQTIRQAGLRGLAKDPLVRSQQLGKLAPAGDLKLTQDLQGLAVVDVARRLLEVGGSIPNRWGKRVLEGSQYRITQSPRGLTVEAKDRGTILKLDRGTLTSKLTVQDVRHFIFVARELSRELKQLPMATALQQRVQIGSAPMQR